MTFLKQNGDFVASKAGLGGRISEARQALNTTQSELAQQLGITTATLKKWELGKSEPRVNRLMTLAGVLGVNPMWLMASIGEGPVEQTPDMDIEALSNDLVEMRHLGQQFIRSIEDMERRIENLQHGKQVMDLKKSA